MDKKSNVIIEKTTTEDIAKEVITHDSPLMPHGMRSEKPCLLCGEPMLVSRGKYQPVLKDGKIDIVKNPDQTAYWHKKCRTKGRELVRKGILSLPKTKVETQNENILDKLVFGGAG